MTIGHFDTTTVKTGLEITLTGGTAQDIDSGSAVAGFLFASNGVTYKYQGGSSSLINLETDWIFPRDTFTAADWEIRGTHQVYTTNTTVTQTGTASIADITSPFAAGAWFGLGSNQSFYYSITGGVATRTADIVVLFEIRNITETSYNQLTSSVDAAPIAGFGPLYAVDLETFPSGAPQGGGCFTGNMLVMMADRTEKPIADVHAGDMVMSYNELTGKLEGSRVMRTMAPRICDIYEIKLSNGKTIETTIEHPFRTASGKWASIDPKATYQPVLGGKSVRTEANAQLQTGMMLHGINDLVTVMDIAKTNRKETVYHLSNVQANYNYFVEGMCVHNTVRQEKV